MKKKIDTGLKYVQKLGISPASDIGCIGVGLKRKKCFESDKELRDYWEEMFSSDSDEEIYPYKNKTYDMAITITGGFDADIVRRVANWIEKNKKYFGQEILEVGCDVGFMSCVLAMQFPNSHITAIDRLPDGIIVAKQLAEKLNLTNITFIQTDLKDLDQEYDTVFDMRCIHENTHTPDIESPHFKMLLDQVGNFYMPATEEYVGILHDHIKIGGTLISVLNCDVDPLLLARMINMALDHLDIQNETVEKIRYKQFNEEHSLIAMVSTSPLTWEEMDSNECSEENREPIAVSETEIENISENGENNDGIDDYEKELIGRTHQLWYWLHDGIDPTAAVFRGWLAEAQLQYVFKELVYGIYLYNSDNDKVAKYGVYLRKDDATSVYLYRCDFQDRVLENYDISELNNAVKELKVHVTTEAHMAGLSVKEYRYSPIDGTEYEV